MFKVQAGFAPYGSRTQNHLDARQVQLLGKGSHSYLCQQATSPFSPRGEFRPSPAKLKPLSLCVTVQASSALQALSDSHQAHVQTGAAGAAQQMEAFRTVTKVCVRARVF